MSTALLEQFCEIAASFYQRGYAFGSTGNLSVRIGSQVWITPTGRSLRSLRPEEIACLDIEGRPQNGNRASKEHPVHLGCYRTAGERAAAVVHLHATHSVALSCLESIGGENPLPVLTPYYLMRVSPLAVLPYFRPGSAELAEAVTAAAATHDAMLLRNHGLICLGRTLEEAVDRAEELEESARLFFLLRNERVRTLTESEREDVLRTFRPKSSLT